MEKKNTGLIVLVVILVVAVLGLGGFIVYDKILENKVENNKMNNNQEIIEQKDDKVIFTDEMLNDLYNKVESLYGHIDYFYDCTWKDPNGQCFDMTTEWTGKYLEISNYEEVVGSILSPNGIQQYEQFMTQESMNVLKKENGKIYIKEPTSGLHFYYDIKNLKISSISPKEVYISVEYGIDYIQNTNNLVYNSYKFKIVNYKGNWLIDNFPLANL